MKSKKINLLIFFVLMLATANIMKSQITLQDAVNQALNKNKGIKSSQLRIDAKNAANSSAWGRYYPNIGIDFKYTHMDKDLVLDLDPIRDVIIGVQAGNQVGFSNLESTLKTGNPLTAEEQAAVKSGAEQKLNQDIPHFKEIIKEQTFPQAAVTLKQPIFTGGKISAGVEASESQIEIEKAKHTEQTEEVINTVISYYLNVLLAESNLKVRNQAFETVTKHAQRANSLMEQGVIPQNDKMRADVALSEANRNLFEANEKLKIAVLALKSIMESDENSEIALAEVLKYKKTDSKASDFIDAAKYGNTKLLQLRAGNKALDAKANAEMADYYPTIYGYGFYNLFKHYLQKSSEPIWGVGIGASFTIFDGFRRNNNYQEAKAEADAVNMFSKEAERKIELLVRSQYMEMRLAEESYQQLEASHDQAEESFRLSSRRFDTGLGTSLELLDSRLALEAIELKRNQTLKDYYTSMANLYEIIGKSDEFLKFWNN